MKRIIFFVLCLFLFISSILAQERPDFEVKEIKKAKKEFTFIGYYFMRMERINVAPTNEFLKGQVVGRLFGRNTTVTSDEVSKFSEQRFLPMITYTPRLFDGWAKMRMSFEFDWTHGDANYTAGGNFGGGFGADVVNMQTQNLFIEFRPKKNVVINAGLLRLYDNVRVPYYTFTDHLIYKGYRLAFFGSDASGVGFHFSPRTNTHLKIGAYQFFENNIEQDDDVQFYEAVVEYDLDIKNSIGFSLWYLKDRANGEGGVSILGQGLNSSLSGYNGVFNFELGSESYKADILWAGTNFHGNALLTQGRSGYSGFALANFGKVDTPSRDIDVFGYAANTRLAYKYGKNPNDHLALDMIYTSGDDNNVSDNKYSGVLTGNNWTAPGAVWFSHGLYLLLPHGNVVNRFNAAVIDIQNMGYGLSAAAIATAYDVIPHKLRIKAGAGIGFANAEPTYTYVDDSNVSHSWTGGKKIGSEVNFNIRYTLKVYMDLELHAAYLSLGDFYETPATNGWKDDRPLSEASEIPKDPWTMFLTLKWIMF
jgi:hypothetical protein